MRIPTIATSVARVLTTSLDNAGDVRLLGVGQDSSCGLGSNNWGDPAKFRRPPIAHQSTDFRDKQAPTGPRGMAWRR